MPASAPQAFHAPMIVKRCSRAAPAQPAEITTRCPRRRPTGPTSGHPLQAFSR
jgi:hypothetical protein